MKKFILSLVVIVSFGLYVVSQNSSNPSNNFTAEIPVATTDNNTSTTKNNSNTVAVTPTTPVVNNSKPKSITSIPTPVVITPPPKKTDMYNDGQYVGNSADAYFGNIQVKAVITGGKLTNVVFLDYPQDRGHSVQINNYAMPILKSEAIQAQNANVNTVSGATDSSGAFVESLSSALAQAKA